MTVGLTGPSETGKTAYILALPTRVESIAGWRIQRGVDELNAYVLYLRAKAEKVTARVNGHVTQVKVWPWTPHDSKFQVALFEASPERHAWLPPFLRKTYRISLPDIQGLRFTQAARSLIPGAVQEPEQADSRALFTVLRRKRALLWLLDLDGAATKMAGTVETQLGVFSSVISKVVESRKRKDPLIVGLLFTKADLILADPNRATVRLRRDQSHRYRYFLERDSNPLEAGMIVSGSDNAGSGGRVEYGLEGAIRAPRAAAKPWLQDPAHLEAVTWDYLTCHEPTILRMIRSCNKELNAVVAPFLISSLGASPKTGTVLDPKTLEELPDPNTGVPPQVVTVLPEPEEIHSFGLVQPLQHVLDRLDPKDRKRFWNRAALFLLLACLVVAALGPGLLWGAVWRARQYLGAKDPDRAVQLLDTFALYHPFVRLNKARAPHLLEGMADAYLASAQQFASQRPLTPVAFGKGMHAVTQAVDLTGSAKHKRWLQDYILDYAEGTASDGDPFDGIAVLVASCARLHGIDRAQETAQRVLERCAQGVREEATQIGDKPTKSVKPEPHEKASRRAAAGEEASLGLLSCGLLAPVDETTNGGSSPAVGEARTQFAAAQALLKVHLPLGVTPALPALVASASKLEEAQHLAAALDAGGEPAKFVGYSRLKVEDKVPGVVQGLLGEAQTALERPEEVISKVDEVLAVLKDHAVLKDPIQAALKKYSGEVWLVAKLSVARNPEGAFQVLDALRAKGLDPYAGEMALRAARSLMRMLRILTQIAQGALPQAAEMQAVLDDIGDCLAKAPQSLQVSVPKRLEWDLREALVEAKEKLCQLVRKQGDARTQTPPGWLDLVRVIGNDCDQPVVRWLLELNGAFETAVSCEPSAAQTGAVADAWTALSSLPPERQELFATAGKALVEAASPSAGAYALVVCLHRLSEELKAKSAPAAEVEAARQMRSEVRRLLAEKERTDSAKEYESRATLLACLLERAQSVDITLPDMFGVLAECRRHPESPRARELRTRVRSEMARLKCEPKAEEGGEEALSAAADGVFDILCAPAQNLEELREVLVDLQPLAPCDPRLEAGHRCGEAILKLEEEKFAGATLPVNSPARLRLDSLLRQGGLDFPDVGRSLSAAGTRLANAGTTYHRALALRNLLCDLGDAPNLDPLRAALDAAIVQVPAGLDMVVHAAYFGQYLECVAAEPNGTKVLEGLFQRALMGTAPACLTEENLDILCQAVAARIPQSRLEAFFVEPLRSVKSQLERCDGAMKDSLLAPALVALARKVNVPRAQAAVKAVEALFWWLSGQAGLEFRRFGEGEEAYFLSRDEVSIKQYRQFLEEDVSLEIEYHAANEKPMFLTRDEGPNEAYRSLGVTDEKKEIPTAIAMQDDGVYAVDPDKVSQYLRRRGARLPTDQEWLNAYDIKTDFTDKTGDADQLLTGKELEGLGDITLGDLRGMTFGVRELVHEGSRAGPFRALGASSYYPGQDPRIVAKLTTGRKLLDVGFRVALDPIPTELNAALK